MTTDSSVHTSSVQVAPSSRISGAGEGTGALGAAPRVDFERLRSTRLANVTTMMSVHDLDSLVLGQESNARYATGARRLWLSGARPFGPGCVVFPDGTAHLLTTWEDGVPASIPFENCYGLTWNPSILVNELRSLAPLTSSSRIGVDGMSFAALRLLSQIAPGAELVDMTTELYTLRAIKIPDELACLRTAAAVTEGCLAHAMTSLDTGAGVEAVTGRNLAGRFMKRLGDYGLTTTASPGNFIALPALSGVSSSPFRPSDDVWLASGALFEGYEADCGRTIPLSLYDHRAASRSNIGWRDLYSRWADLREAIIAACAAGAPASGLLLAYSDHGVDPPPCPVAHGLGLGVEPPIIGEPGRYPAGDTELRAGMVLGVTAMVKGGDHAFASTDTVCVTSAGGEAITRLAFALPDDPPADDD